MLDERPLAEVLALADAATTVPRDLHRAHAAAAVLVDLDALWRDPGVRPQGGLARFDDAAPLAAMGGRIPRGDD